MGQPQNPSQRTLDTWQQETADLIRLPPHEMRLAVLQRVFATASRRVFLRVESELTEVMVHRDPPEGDADAPDTKVMFSLPDRPPTSTELSRMASILTDPHLVDPPCLDRWGAMTLSSDDAQRLAGWFTAVLGRDGTQLVEVLLNHHRNDHPGQPTDDAAVRELLEILKVRLEGAETIDALHRLLPEQARDRLGIESAQSLYSPSTFRALLARSTVRQEVRVALFKLLRAPDVLFAFTGVQQAWKELPKTRSILPGEYRSAKIALADEFAMNEAAFRRNYPTASERARFLQEVEEAKAHNWKRDIHMESDMDCRRLREEYDLLSDVNALAAKERTIISEAFLRVLPLFHTKVGGTAEHIEGLPTNVLAGGDPNCFSALWLVCALMLRSGMRAEDILYCDVHEDEGDVQGKTHRGSHSALLVQLSNGDRVIVDPAHDICCRDFAASGSRSAKTPAQIYELFQGRRKEATRVRPRRNIGPITGTYRDMHVLPLYEGITSKHLLNLGIAAMEQGHWEECRYTLELALSMNPQDQDVLHQLAVCHLREGRTEEAERLSRKALESVEYHLGARLTLGEVLLARGKTQEAETIFRGLVKDMRQYWSSPHEHTDYRLVARDHLVTMGVLSADLVAVPDTIKKPDEQAQYLRLMYARELHLAETGVDVAAGKPPLGQID